MFALAAFLAVRYVLAYYQREPRCYADAYSIWNLKARFLHAGGNGRDAFSPLLPHADYPFLLPASVARHWAYGARIRPSPRCSWVSSWPG